VQGSECALAALAIQNAKRMRHVKLSSVASPVLQNISTLSHKRHDYRKEATERKICVLSFPSNLSETILILSRI